ncbi:MAG: T9SS type A sorting domain-containing protein [Bacteroidetes bacterium]|nr:T9SS type A sorting domain-containing protein [Bacteroidota bacterium]
MKRIFSLLCVVLAVNSIVYAARPQRVLGPGTGSAHFREPYHQVGHVTLYKDTTYILTGWYFVDSLSSITIQAGTLILGDSASAGTLIIRRGAKIFASGTPTEPIVFTSSKPPGQRRPGDWGGVIILGNAPTNKPTTQQVEGGFGTIPNSDAMYGGNDPADSSGVFRYVRIEFAGSVFSQDNESNGLTLGGVGNRTLIEYVQVSFGNDDDFEFFGGTVNARYLVSWRNLDDNIDTDFGYSGKIQFVYVKRDPMIFDASAAGASNGFESDNEGRAPYTATPRTNARISNVTLIGPAWDSTEANNLNSKWDNTALIRRASEFSIYNSILVGWRKGINLRDSLTQLAALEGRLEIRNTSLAAPTSVLQVSSSPSAGLPTGFNIRNWFLTPEFGNKDTLPRTAWAVGLTQKAFALDGTNDPRPLPGSEAATAGTNYSSGRLAGDSWFIRVSYRGAFDPSLPMSLQWTARWTNFDPQNTDYSGGVTSVQSEDGNAELPFGYTLYQNYPNPFNPATTIGFYLPQQEHVTITVYNVLGQKVCVLANGVYPQGQHYVNFDGSAVASGLYFYTLKTSSFTQTKKMLLAK